MKTGFSLFVSILLLSGAAEASDLRPFGVGVETSIPFTLMVDGNGVRGRQNLNVAIDGRYWWNEEGNAGLRFSFDAEKRSGSLRRLGLAPGVARHFLPNEDWSPYLRLDVPMLFRGAPNEAGSADQFDIGFSGGAGVAWKLGDAIGWPGMEFRYDFDISYFIGAGGALSVLALDLFRVGVDYRF
jgi:hypothetical protein